MGFSLNADEAVGAGVRRIVDEQLAEALSELRTAGDTEPEQDKAVHSARKRMKRLRAVIRLVRAELGGEVYERENAGFRDAGGALAEARDAAVLVLTLGKLKDDLDPAVYESARRKLLTRRRAVKKRVMDEGEGLEGVAKAAQAARDRASDWVIDGDGWPAVRPGLRRAYRDGRACMSASVLGATVGHGAEMFHEWRKRVKDLWHQTEILEKVWKPIMGPLADEFHELADLLGDEHDLAVLRDVLSADATARGQSADSPDIAPVIHAADARRLSLQTRALSLGARLFAEKTGPFVRRIGKYWKAWKQGRSADANAQPEPATNPASAHDLPALESDPIELEIKTQVGIEQSGAAPLPIGHSGTEQSGGSGT